MLYFSHHRVIPALLLIWIGLLTRSILCLIQEIMKSYTVSKNYIYSFCTKFRQSNSDLKFK